MATRTPNPFKPTAGRMPPLLIGRDAIIDEFEEALDDGPGAPGRLMRVTGARGVGKTVMLTEFGRIANALSRLGDAVHGPELDGLSPIDKTYLLAMAQDDGPSSTSTIAARMGKDLSYANVYRSRLIEAQVIRDMGYGKVDFAIPYLRQYLREHAAYLRLNGVQAAES